MSSSFDIPDVDLLTAGAEGPPGQRVFYLQARHDGRVVSLRLEKSQVAALCRYLESMLENVAPAEPAAGDMSLVEPVVAEWVVGNLRVQYDDAVDRFVLEADELVEEGEDGATARISATRAQVAAMIRHGNEVVASGRPPCPLCGGPLDPEGHVCVRLNGHRDLAP